MSIAIVAGPVPVVPVSLLEPIREQFSILLPPRPAVAPTHPLGCHRPRIPDRVVFEQVVAALVHGSGYERIATAGCSDRTIRRRLHEWAEAGLAETLHHLVLEQYDRMIGLELAVIAVNGCITKAPCGGGAAGRSPVDRGKQGLKRSTATDATGVPASSVWRLVGSTTIASGWLPTSVDDRRGGISRPHSPTRRI